MPNVLGLLVCNLTNSCQKGRLSWMYHTPNYCRSNTAACRQFIVQNAHALLGCAVVYGTPNATKIRQNTRSSVNVLVNVFRETFTKTFTKTSRIFSYFCRIWRSIVVQVFDVSLKLAWGT